MTPPAAGAATAAVRPHRTGRSRARPPRRPPLRPIRSHPRRVAAARAGAAGSVALPAPSDGPLERLARAIATLPDHPLVCRLVGGPAWIWLLGIGLGGIVFMQVSTLKMNSGMGRDVETATQLERSNALLETSVARLSSGDRIEAAAVRQGMLAAPAEDTRFLRAQPGRDGGRAARTMRGQAQPAPTASTPPAGQQAPSAPQQQAQGPSQPPPTQQQQQPQTPATTTTPGTSTTAQQPTPLQQPSPDASTGGAAPGANAPPTGGAPAGG